MEKLPEQHITEAYHYLLGRLLVLRQQEQDFRQDGFRWNQLVHRKPGAVAWVNPNLDVAYSEAWVALDQRTGVLLDIPRIPGRYYTWHMLNGWGETVLNINERTFPDHPWGRFLLCLRDSSTVCPEGTRRVELPAAVTRVLARIDLGNAPDAAIRLQPGFHLTPLGEPEMPPRITVPPFDSRNLPGVEVFDLADAILAGEPDINPGMDTVRRQAKTIASAVTSAPKHRAAVAEVIRGRSLPALRALLKDSGQMRNGWVRPACFGRYGEDYRMRTVINLLGIWANTPEEYGAFSSAGLDGSSTYVQTFPAQALPQTKARHFWSVTAVSTKDQRVIPNPHDRHTRGTTSPLRHGPDGSLSLVYAPRCPAGLPEENWLPTPEHGRFSLTFRLYGPSEDVYRGDYFPPALVKAGAEGNPAA